MSGRTQEKPDTEKDGGPDVKDTDDGSDSIPDRDRARRPSRPGYRAGPRVDPLARTLGLPHLSWGRVPAFARLNSVSLPKHGPDT